MKISVVVFLILGMVALIYLLAFSKTGGTMNTYSVKQLKEKIDNGDALIILDVRTPQEFNGEFGHIENAILIPVQELQYRIGELDAYRDKEIVAICRTQNRSRVAASILKDAGFDRIAYTHGGMVEWNRHFGNGQRE
jgi:rhodanese-related sulfurtransferase